MIDFLTHYYSADAVPFQSLSELPDGDAIRIMEGLYCRHKGNILFERFGDPAQYLRNRRDTENWVRSSFIRKGGRPVESFPVSMVLGFSKWIERHAPDQDLHAAIRIPLSGLSETEVSFTFPDSMVSRWLSTEKPGKYYLPEYHGKVFTLKEILTVIQEKGLPEETWNIEIPKDTGAYIEAQVWNRRPLEKYKPGGG